MPNQGYTYQKEKDQKEKDDEVKDIDLFMGVFFDGTGNNEDNIDSYNEFKNSSWLKKVFTCIKEVKYHVTARSSLRGYSNVARLHKIYKQDKSCSTQMATSVYVQGIGTTTVIDVKIPGQAFGTGFTGVNSKVENGCNDVTKEVVRVAKKLVKKPCKIKLHLAVIGFSRGAAAARRFSSCLDSTSGKKHKMYDECLAEHLKKKCKKKGMLREVKVQLDFLGLFDTVSSYGVIKTIKSESDNVSELGLSMSKINAKKVVQLCAGDEYRDHFSLTTTGKDIEYIIPGAHADVGGGYCDKEEEEWKVTQKMDIKKGRMKTLFNGYRTKQDLIDEGWFSHMDIKAGKREVSSSYSLIPFAFMKKELKDAISYGVIDASKLSSLKYDNTPSDLAAIKGKILSKEAMYSFQGSGSKKKISKFGGDENMIKTIRHKYLHLSASTGISDHPADKNTRVIVDGK